MRPLGGNRPKLPGPMPAGRETAVVDCVPICYNTVHRQAGLTGSRSFALKYRLLEGDLQ